jgi:hypothetical protein
VAASTPRPRRGRGVVDRTLEAFPYLLEVGAHQLAPLESRTFSGDDRDGRRRAVEQLGQEVHDRGVRPTVDRRGSYPDLEGITMASDQRATTGTGLYVDAHDHIVANLFQDVAEIGHHTPNHR